MMNFIVSFCCSIAGSLTPGTINLSVLQSGLYGHRRTGQRMALAAGLMEYLYAWLAIRFESIISASIAEFHWFKLIASLVLLTLGLMGIRKQSSPEPSPVAGGFRKGLLLGVLNPMAMPYWLGIVAYLKSLGWVQFDSWIDVHSFLFGVSLGVVSLLFIINHTAVSIQQKGWVKSSRIAAIPGYVMIVLGLIGFFVWLTSLLNTVA